MKATCYVLIILPFVILAAAARIIYSGLVLGWEFGEDIIKGATK